MVQWKMLHTLLIRKHHIPRFALQSSLLIRLIICNSSNPLGLWSQFWQMTPLKTLTQSHLCLHRHGACWDCCLPRMSISIATYTCMICLQRLTLKCFAWDLLGSADQCQKYYTPYEVFYCLGVHNQNRFLAFTVRIWRMNYEWTHPSVNPSSYIPLQDQQIRMYGAAFNGVRP